jgi:hypothetical protein
MHDPPPPPYVYHLPGTGCRGLGTGYTGLVLGNRGRGPWTSNWGPGAWGGRGWVGDWRLGTGYRGLGSRDRGLVNGYRVVRWPGLGTVTSDWGLSIVHRGLGTGDCGGWVSCYGCGDRVQWVGYRGLVHVHALAHSHTCTHPRTRTHTHTRTRTQHTHRADGRRPTGCRAGGRRAEGRRAAGCRAAAHGLAARPPSDSARAGRARPALLSDSAAGSRVRAQVALGGTGQARIVLQLRPAQPKGQHRVNGPKASRRQAVSRR